MPVSENTLARSAAPRSAPDRNQNRLGSRRHGIDVTAEYARLAEEDESAASLLQQSGCHRQAIYFYVQAMEKRVRAKIFTLVSPTHRFFRDENRHHSVEEALVFLLKVIRLDTPMAETVQKMVDRYVIGGIEYARLHNNLRYPYFSERFQSYSCLDVGKAVVARVAEALRYLKTLLIDLDRFR